MRMFPDFYGPEENVGFFKRYVKLADTIVKESYHLVKFLGSSFKKKTPASKIMIKEFSPSDYPFEFYLFSELNKSTIFLVVNPFGSEVFDTDTPTFLIQHRFKSSIIKKQRILQKLSKYIDACLKRKGRVETDDYVFNDTHTSKDVMDHLKDRKNNDTFFSIFEQIEILGIEKDQIQLNVEKTLQRIVDFSNSLK